jgi:hypothetical protein
MKKILSLATILFLSSTTIGADNKITITGKILPSAVVGFEAVNTEALGDDKFIDATIDLGEHEVDDFNANALSESTRSIYVKTNIPTGGAVTIAINSNNGDDLKDSVSGETIPVKYKIGDTELKTDGSNAVTIATRANDGSSAIDDKFTVTPNADDDQLAGTYGAELTVTISAN